MVQIDVPMSVGFGATLAVAAARQIATGAAERRRVFLAGAMVQGCALTPIILYYLVRFPGWDTMYFFARPNAPWLVPAVAFLSFGGFAAAFHLAAKWVAAAEQGKALALAAVAWLLVGGIPLVWFRRFIRLGTYEEFHAGAKMKLIFFSWPYMATTIVSAAVLALAIRWLIHTVGEDEGAAAR